MVDRATVFAAAPPCKLTTARAPPHASAGHAVPRLKRSPPPTRFPATQIRCLARAKTAHAANKPPFRVPHGSQLVGQDYVVALHDPHESPGGEALCLVLDGHGLQGHLWSSICGEHLKRCFLHNWEALTELCVQNDVDRVDALVSRWFADAHARARRWLRSTPAASRSGTTASVVVVVCDRATGRRFAIHANVGDSPALLAEGDEKGPAPIPMWEDHSVDNKQEYARYRRRCAQAGRAHAEWIFSRVNVPHGLCHPDPNVKAPLPMYQYDEGTGAVTVDSDAHATLLRGFPFPGGTQSVRRQPQSGQEHANWGSTIKGGLQVTRTLGDENEKAKHYLDCEAHVGVLELDAESTYTVCVGSDGFFDCFEYEQPLAIARRQQWWRSDEQAAGLGQHSPLPSHAGASQPVQQPVRKSATRSQALQMELAGALHERMCANVAAANADALEKSGLKLFRVGAHGEPEWDDISACILHLRGASQADHSARPQKRLRCSSPTAVSVVGATEHVVDDGTSCVSSERRPAG